MGEQREVNGVPLLAAMGVAQDEIDPAVLAKHDATFRVWTVEDEDATHPLLHRASDPATHGNPRIVLIGMLY
jgi:hypothetical protein